MSTTLERIQTRSWVRYVDDERNTGNGIIVTLEDRWEFTADPGCGTRGFDTVTEALQGTSKTEVQHSTKLNWTQPS